MAYGLVIKNKDGIEVIRYDDQIANIENVALTTTVPAGGSASVAVTDVQDPTQIAVLPSFEEDQIDVITVDTATTDTLTFNNSGAANVDVSVELVRLF